MKTDPSPEHLWLQQLVGEWEFHSECSMGPDQPPMKASGRETVRAVGDLWIQAEMTGDMPDDGASMTAFMTLGFDPTKGKFVGNWIGSPMAHMFIYEGQRENGGDTLPLNTTGPSFTDPTKMAQYRDIIEIKSKDERLLRSEAQNEDGSWTPFMQATYKRVK